VARRDPKGKRGQSEPEEDRQFDALDDPVRMYMNQMGKVPLLTREQEVELCKRMEAAEIEMKRLVYGLASQPRSTCDCRKASLRASKGTFRSPRVDKKMRAAKGISRTSALVKKMQALDAQVDEHYKKRSGAPAGCRGSVDPQQYSYEQ